MKVLYIHQNFPGQYQHLARYLDAAGGNQIVYITQRVNGELLGVGKIVYKPSRGVTPGIPM
jgi:uncharacterized protein YraI